MNNSKEFGVWMDNHHASVVGCDNAEGRPLKVLAQINGEITSPNSNEKTSNNHEKMVQGKFFKEITSHMLNATHVHVTGPGQVQEQFIHYLANTPQFKNSKTEESTSTKMSDEKLIEYISARL